MSAIVGAAGLPPGLKALEQGTTLALANKESLVTAGPLLLRTARKKPRGHHPARRQRTFRRLPGPERGRDRHGRTHHHHRLGRGLSRLAAWKTGQATPEQASSHPNWDMGQRITIDSASMFNKALGTD